MAYAQPPPPITSSEDQFLHDGMPFANVKDDGLSRFMLEPQDIIEELEHFFKGEVWTEKGWKQIKTRCMMNDKGVNKFLTILRGHLSKVVSLSNLSLPEIKRMSFECRQAVIDEIYYNAEKFEIDKSFRDTLVMVIDHKVYCFLKQALDGAMLTHLQTTERHIETRRDGDPSSSDPSAKRGGLSKVFGRIF